MVLWNIWDWISCFSMAAAPFTILIRSSVSSNFLFSYQEFKIVNPPSLRQTVGSFRPARVAIIIRSPYFSLSFFFIVWFVGTVPVIADFNSVKEN